MECFKIEWKPPLPFDKAVSLPEAKSPGIYALSEADNPSIYYIGQTKELFTRMTQYRRGDSSHMRDTGKVSVSVGIAYFVENNIPSPATSEQVKDIEKFFISEVKPERNIKGKEGGYRGRAVIIVNTGEELPHTKNGRIAKVMSHDSVFLKLLKDNLGYSDW